MEEIRMIKSNIIKITEPDGTKTRISRCTDQQALPVSNFRLLDIINLSGNTELGELRMEGNADCERRRTTDEDEEGKFKYPKEGIILSHICRNMESKNQKEILNLFRKNVFLKASIRELSKRLNKKSYQRVYDAVKELERRRILELERVGKSDIVSLELNHQSVLHLSYLDEIESMGKIPSYEKLAGLKEISNYLLIVTGSYAKGNFTKKSDLDLVIVIPDNQKAIDVQRRVENLTLAFYPKVHLYVFNNKDFLEMLLDKKENYGKEIYRNHLILRNAHTYYEILREARERGFKG